MTTLRTETMLVLADLIGFPTVTSEPNLDLIAYADELLRAVGATTTMTHDLAGHKANLFATIGPPVDGGVVLSGHTDVVPAGDEGWTGSPFLATRRDERIYGRGAADMKGFIACMLAMAPSFAAADLSVPIHIALTFDEEIGLRGAPILLSDLVGYGPMPMAAIVGEPTCMGIIAAHKGLHEYTTTITGVEGHASAPARGVNAIDHAVRYVAHLLELRDELAKLAPADSPFDPPETTISIGTIRGGAARNVIAGSCSFDWEARPIRAADAERVRTSTTAFEARLRAELRAQHPDAKLTTETLVAAGGLEDVKDSAAVALVADLLGSDSTRVASFCTEAGFFHEAGIPAVVCGPGSIDVAHQADEYVEIEQLEACLGMLGRLTERLRTP